MWGGEGGVGGVVGGEGGVGVVGGEGGVEGEWVWGGGGRGKEYKSPFNAFSVSCRVGTTNFSKIW